jgi:acyl-coenzyme A synthetase/AMP-(fatty) acid ligase
MRLPLLFERPAESIFAFGRSGVVTLGQFLADVERLASRLPARAHVLNDCNDRYHFLVGFAAALVRGQVSLFPGNRVTHVWQQLGEDYPDVYCLTDQDAVPAVMDVMRFTPSGAPSVAVRAVPAFPVEQPAAIAFTSGSTGRPRPFPKYWGAIVQEARAGARALGIAPGDTRAIVATVPPQHMYGFVASAMLPLQLGLPVSRERPFYPEDVRLALESSPTPGPILVITPVQLRACVLERAALPRLAFILSSAAPLPRALADEAEALFGTRVLEYYGSSETGAIASRRQQESEVWRAFDGVRVSPHAEGCLVAAEYFREPVVLNDAVEILSAREFRLVGRSTDLIKIGGKRTSLLYLNQQLGEIPGVADGAFVLEEGAGGKEPRLAALVVAPGRSREDILGELRTRLDEVFVPRKLWLVPALPRNAAGKLPREQLLDLLREQLETETRPARRD